ncbi:hypothetical protein [Paenibacillus guangzhouensis]|uniref:hypothetical protein n=1 Tax=Paenibacillus guangzhouensis TaxID=1473112 RepID=UPI001266FC56|nr:hypothetical protein [Paenibacillus guangzhouensis]
MVRNRLNYSGAIQEGPPVLREDLLVVLICTVDYGSVRSIAQFQAFLGLKVVKVKPKVKNELSAPRKLSEGEEGGYGV